MGDRCWRWALRRLTKTSRCLPMDPGPCVTSHWPSPTLPLHPCSGTWCSHPGQGTRSRAHTHLAGTALPCPSTAGGAALQITQGCRGRNSLLRQIQTFPFPAWLRMCHFCPFVRVGITFKGLFVCLFKHRPLTGSYFHSFSDHLLCPAA